MKNYKHLRQFKLSRDWKHKQNVSSLDVHAVEQKTKQLANQNIARQQREPLTGKCLSKNDFASKYSLKWLVFFMDATSPSDELMIFVCEKTQSMGYRKRIPATVKFIHCFHVLCQYYHVIDVFKCSSKIILRLKRPEKKTHRNFNDVKCRRQNSRNKNKLKNHLLKCLSSVFSRIDLSL